MRKNEGDAALHSKTPCNSSLLQGVCIFTKIYSSHRYALRNRIALYETISVYHTFIRAYPPNNYFGQVKASSACNSFRNHHIRKSTAPFELSLRARPYTPPQPKQ